MSDLAGLLGGAVSASGAGLLTELKPPAAGLLVPRLLVSGHVAQGEGRGPLAGTGWTARAFVMPEADMALLATETGEDGLAGAAPEAETAMPAFLAGLSVPDAPATARLAVLAEWQRMGPALAAPMGTAAGADVPEGGLEGLGVQEEGGEALAEPLLAAPPEARMAGLGVTTRPGGTAMRPPLQGKLDEVVDRAAPELMADAGPSLVMPVALMGVAAEVLRTDTGLRVSERDMGGPDVQVRPHAGLAGVTLPVLAEVRGAEAFAGPDRGRLDMGPKVRVGLPEAGTLTLPQAPMGAAQAALPPALDNEAAGPAVPAIMGPDVVASPASVDPDGAEGDDAVRPVLRLLTPVVRELVAAAAGDAGRRDGLAAPQAPRETGVAAGRAAVATGQDTVLAPVGPGETRPLVPPSGLSPPVLSPVLSSVPPQLLPLAAPVSRALPPVGEGAAAEVPVLAAESLLALPVSGGTGAEALGATALARPGGVMTAMATAAALERPLVETAMGPVRISVEGESGALRVVLRAPELAVAALEGGRGALAAALAAQGMRLETLAVRPEAALPVSAVVSSAALGVVAGGDVAADAGGREAGEREGSGRDEMRQEAGRDQGREAGRETGREPGRAPGREFGREALARAAALRGDMGSAVRAEAVQGTGRPRPADRFA